MKLETFDGIIYKFLQHYFMLTKAVQVTLKHICDDRSLSGMRIVIEFNYVQFHTKLQLLLLLYVIVVRVCVCVQLQLKQLKI